MKFVAVTVVVSLLPSLGPVLGVASIFSGVFVLNKLLKAFWCALTPEQQENIRGAATDAGVPMPEAIDVESTSDTHRGTAAGYDEVDPTPTPA